MRKSEKKKKLTLNEEGIEKLKGFPEGAKIVKRANSVARKCGASIATELTIGHSDQLLSRTRPGYIYKGTGCYVSSGCSHFRDVYYQRALAHVELEGYKSGYAKTIRGLLS